jgi:hypothetical protein
MDAEPAVCPHCDKVIEPRPRRGRKCPHCGEPIVVRKGALLAPDQKPSAPLSEEPPPRLARFKVFRSALDTWDTLFAEAAEFVTAIGPERLITISHSADEGEGLVTVWYWDGPEWDGIGEVPPSGDK